MDNFGRCLENLMKEHGWTVANRLKNGVMMRSPDGKEEFCISGKTNMHVQVAEQLGLDPDKVLEKCLQQ